jgi:hypothetical protein
MAIRRSSARKSSGYLKILVRRLVGGCSAVVCIFALALGSTMGDEKTPVEGAAFKGLRLGLNFIVTESGGKRQRHCNLVLQNVGDTDLNVWLGFSLANGKSHHPSAVRLFARSKGHKTQTLIYPSLVVSERVDPFVLPLLAGSSYTMPCPFYAYVDSEAGERIDLTSKDYWISSELTGEAITKTNQDLQGLALMTFWEGKVRSNEVQLPFSKKPE